MLDYLKWPITMARHHFMFFISTQRTKLREIKSAATFPVQLWPKGLSDLYIWILNNILERSNIIWLILLDLPTYTLTNIIILFYWRRFQICGTRSYSTRARSMVHSCEFSIALHSNLIKRFTYREHVYTK